MSAPGLQDALATWRQAERRWESIDPGDPDYRPAALEVVSAWLSYHEASETERGTFVLIVDDEARYVGVSRGVTDILGYAPEELVGRKIESVVAAGVGVDPAQDWQRFLIDGRQEGEYSMLDRDGGEVRLRYQARAHHPIPGYHLSRLRPTD
jgi:PAS domain S-box-containing protein